VHEPVARVLVLQGAQASRPEPQLVPVLARVPRQVLALAQARQSPQQPVQKPAV
jgi:hypothetical protein